MEGSRDMVSSFEKAEAQALVKSVRLVWSPSTAPAPTETDRPIRHEVPSTAPRTLAPAPTTQSGHRIESSTTDPGPRRQPRPTTVRGPTRAPSSIVTPASMKAGLWTVEPDATTASPATAVRDAAGVANGPAWKRPSRMSWWTWVYLAGVPMSIQ